MKKVGHTYRLIARSSRQTR